MSKRVGAGSTDGKPPALGPTEQMLWYRGPVRPLDEHMSWSTRLGQSSAHSKQQYIHSFMEE
jgi:hypothetical protein